MFLRKTRDGRDPLPVAMSGVRMGERVLQIGIDDPQLAGAIAAKVGISGHAAIVVRDEREAARARRAAERAGALVDVHLGSIEMLPFAASSFDVAVVHDMDSAVAGLVAMVPEATLHAVHGVLRAGGRLLLLTAGTPTGVRRLFGAQSKTPTATEDILRGLDAGFKAARLLADREGYRFIEGLKA